MMDKLAGPLILGSVVVAVVVLIMHAEIIKIGNWVFFWIK